MRLILENQIDTFKSRYLYINQSRVSLRSAHCFYSFPLPTFIIPGVIFRFLVSRGKSAIVSSSWYLFSHRFSKLLNASTDWSGIAQGVGAYTIDTKTTIYAKIFSSSLFLICQTE